MALNSFFPLRARAVECIQVKVTLNFEQAIVLVASTVSELWQADPKSDFFTKHGQLLESLISQEDISKLRNGCQDFVPCTLVVLKLIHDRNNEWRDQEHYLTRLELAPSNYAMTNELQSILSANPQAIQSRFPALIGRLAAYRAYQMHEYMRREHVLSYGFHTTIYCNDHQSKQHLIESMKSQTNPVIASKFSDLLIPAIDLLYAKLEYFDASPRHALWSVPL